MGEARKLMAIPVADGHRASRICDYAAQILRKLWLWMGPGVAIKAPSHRPYVDAGTDA
jgi:hypothetical protein